MFRTPSIKSARFFASRVALVAQKRIFSTPFWRITSANLTVAARVRSMAVRSNCPVLSTPWPRRTISISRAISRKCAPSTSAISKRIEFVPQSIAATRMGYPSTIEARQPGLHLQMDLHLVRLLVCEQRVSANTLRVKAFRLH